MSISKLPRRTSKQQLAAWLSTVHAQPCDMADASAYVVNNSVILVLDMGADGADVYASALPSRAARATLMSLERFIQGGTDDAATDEASG